MAAMATHEAGGLDDAAEALYGAPFRAFATERKRLAAELRAAGRVADARAVLRWQKPSLSAWAVNQLWRRARGDFDALVRAGQALRRATARGGATIADATRAQRDALARLRAAAALVL